MASALDVDKICQASIKLQGDFQGNYPDEYTNGPSICARCRRPAYAGTEQRAVRGLATLRGIYFQLTVACKTCGCRTGFCSIVKREEAAA